jgi:hypothetical protein
MTWQTRVMDCLVERAGQSSVVLRPIVNQRNLVIWVQTEGFLTNLVNVT